MKVQDGIKLLLSSRDSAGWSQMSREELINFAANHDIWAQQIFADACLSIGIGDGEPELKVEFIFKPEGRVSP